MTSTDTTTPRIPNATTPIQQVSVDVEPAPAHPGAWNDDWAARYANCLWQLGASPDTVAAALEEMAGLGLTGSELEADYETLTRELALRNLSEAWRLGTEICQFPQDPSKPTLPPWSPPQQPPSKTPTPTPTPPPSSSGPGMPPNPPSLPPSSEDPNPGTPPSPPNTPPGSSPDMPPGPPTSGPPSHPPLPTTPPPDGGFPTPTPGPGPKPPSPTPTPTPTPIPDPGKDPDGDDGGSLAPWLIGLGVLGAIGIGAAVHSGSRSRRALTALAAGFDKGTLGQGGMRAVLDAHEGARLARGITSKDLRAVSLPIINRIGDNARLRSLALGHLDKLEVTAAMAATHEGIGAALHIREDVRSAVLADLERGTSLADALKPFQRDAAPYEAYMKDAALIDVYDELAIVEKGTHPTGNHVISAETLELAELAIVDRHIVETGSGRTPDITRLTVRRGADLDGRGLAEAVGTIKGERMSRQPPGSWKLPLTSAGIKLEDAQSKGVVDAFIDRMRVRYAAGRGGFHPLPSAPGTPPAAPNTGAHLPSAPGAPPTAATTPAALPDLPIGPLPTEPRLPDPTDLPVGPLPVAPRDTDLVDLPIGPLAARPASARHPVMPDLPPPG